MQPVRIVLYAGAEKQHRHDIAAGRMTLLICREQCLTLKRECFPGFRHDQQLLALIFVLRMRDERVTRAGMSPIGGSLVQGFIIFGPHLCCAAFEEGHASCAARITEHIAPVYFPRVRVGHGGKQSVKGKDLGIGERRRQRVRRIAV